MSTIGYIDKFEQDLKGTGKSGKPYTYGMLTWITNEGDERKDRIFSFGDSEKDYNLLRKLKQSDKIAAELKQNDKFFNLVAGTVKYLQKGDGTIPVQKKEKPKSGFGGKKPYDNIEKEKRVSFVWSIHNATEYASLVNKRTGKEVPLEAIKKIRKRLLLECYKFKSPEIGRSFIGVAINLYEEESIEDLNGVIAMAQSLLQEYEAIAKDLVPMKVEDNSEPVPEGESQNDEPQPEGNNDVPPAEENYDDLPF